MRSIKFFGLITIMLPTLFIYSQTFTFQQSISSSTDDAEEKYDGSYITTSSSDLEMMYDSWNSQGLQTVGLRFSNITIPSNAIIVNAYIQFTADGSSSGNIDITIKGENNAYSSTFSNTSNNISNRNTTASNVVWTPSSSWIDNASGFGQSTPDLSTIVSEVISSNGWQIGNPITFIINGNGNSSDFREAYSFDGNSSKSAQLFIEYNPNLNIDLALTSINSPSNTVYPLSLIHI